MIHLYGTPDTQEYDAALALRSAIEKKWPRLSKSADDDLTIIVGAKCHGQRVSDIDLLVIGHFASGLTYTPAFAFESGGHSVRPNTVEVESLCFVIEVKDHPPSQVRFVGNRVEVLYQTGWKDVSEQSHSQMHSLRNYLRLNGVNKQPWVIPLIWLRNVPNYELPALRPHNIFGSGTTWEWLLSVAGQLHIPRLQSKTWTFTANNLDSGSVRRVTELLTHKIEPTTLDRRRMEQINQRVAEQSSLLNLVGQKLVMVRGRGGSGKTIRLLQLAKTLYEQQNARVLVLTYNRALVADLRRLLTFLGIGDDVVARSIQVQTVHSFFYAALRALGVFDPNEEDFIENYPTYKAEALEFITSGVLTSTDMDAIRTREAFSWDYIFVDEGQDWPDDERLILFALYPSQVFTIADGIDQLIRGTVTANWLDGLTRNQYHTEALRTCLRMKSGLTRFVSALAAEFGLPQSEWVANDEVPGGKVRIITGDILDNRTLFDELISSNAAANNRPVDMLFCLPPNLVNRNNNDEQEVASDLSRALVGWGYQIWDGTLYHFRESYPTDVNQLRIVQYDSCRGLEGWIAVHLELETFYDYKFNQMLAAGKSEDEARLHALRWLLIPLTRAMDTLVIHVKNQQSMLYKALQHLIHQYSDTVQLG